MWEVVCFYDIGNRMLNNGVSRMLLRYWKSYVVPCGKSYVVTKLEIVCCTMWEVVCFYDIGNRMLNNGESRTGCLYVVTKLEIVCCTMWEVVCCSSLVNFWRWLCVGFLTWDYCYVSLCQANCIHSNRQTADIPTTWSKKRFEPQVLLPFWYGTLFALVVSRKSHGRHVVSFIRKREMT